MKKILLLLCVFALAATACSAAPLTNYSLGHASLDGNFDINIVVSENYKDQGTNKSYNLNGAAVGTDFAATFGIAQGQYGGFAFQTRLMNYDGPSVSINGVNTWISMEKQEYNAVYQIPLELPLYIQPYIGLDFINAGVGSKTNDPTNRSYVYPASYGFHAGIGVDVPFSNNWNAYGNISGGNSFFNIGAGIAYSLTSNFDVNAGLKYDCIFGSNLASGSSNNLGIITPYAGLTLKI